MKLQTKDCKLVFNQVLGSWIFFTQVPDTMVDELNKIVTKDCVKSIEIKNKTGKRSLNANAYYWSILHQIAVKNRSTDEETHEFLLRRYGTKEYVATLEEAEPLLKRAYKFVDRVEPSMINGKQGFTFRLIRGSSTYDPKEMSVLIDGLISEANLLQISTLTPQETEKLMQNYREEWGKNV